MKDIQFSDEFTPAGAPKTEGTAATIGAGVILMELYAAVGKKGRTVIAGTSHTFGAAGGYIQGGGHSLLGPWKGMSADNALGCNVVTASVSDRTFLALNNTY
jgi:FAD/FMN-containing dehydrogenase